MNLMMRYMNFKIASIKYIIIFLNILCLTKSSSSQSNNYYILEGFVYSLEFPRHLIINEPIVINKDTIFSDSMGRYIYFIPIPSICLSSPKKVLREKIFSSNLKFSNIEIIVRGKQIQLKNKINKYYTKNVEKSRIPVFHYDIPIEDIKKEDRISQKIIRIKHLKELYSP